MRKKIQDRNFFSKAYKAGRVLSGFVSTKTIHILSTETAGIVVKRSYEYKGSKQQVV